MKASEMIKKLQDIINNDGDMEIIFRYEGDTFEGYSIVSDPPTEMEKKEGIEGTIDINLY